MSGARGQARLISLAHLRHESGMKCDFHRVVTVSANTPPTPSLHSIRLPVSDWQPAGNDVNTAKGCHVSSAPPIPSFSFLLKGLSGLSTAPGGNRASARLRTASIIYVRVPRWEQTADQEQAERLIRYLDAAEYAAGWKGFGGGEARGKPSFLLVPISLAKNVITERARGPACERQGAADESDCGQVPERREEPPLRWWHRCQDNSAADGFSILSITSWHVTAGSAQVNESTFHAGGSSGPFCVRGLMEGSQSTCAAPAATSPRLQLWIRCKLW